MSNNEPQINYSHFDIEQYLNGKMTNAEMHQLEMAAIKDPFLADAIEGYKEASVTTSEKHLKEIELNILGERQQAKVVSITKKKNRNFITIAASVIGLGMATALTILLIKNNEEKNNIASLDTKKIVAAKTDSLTNINPPKQEVKIKSNNAIGNTNNDVIDFKTETNQKPIADGGEISKITRKDADGVVDAYDLDPNAPKEVSKPAIAQANADDKINIAKDTIISLNNATVSNQANYFNNQAIALNKPRKGFSAENNYNTNANTQQQIVNLNTIQLKKDKNYKEPETIAIATANKKTKQERKFKLTKEDSLAVPENGWAAYNEYLRNNTAEIGYMDTTATYTAINTKTGQTVELEFEVDEKGNAQNINVIKGLNNSSDSTAINLLKNGPKWSNGLNEKKNTMSKGLNNNKGKVVIKINN